MGVSKAVVNLSKMVLPTFETFLKSKKQKKNPIEKNYFLLFHSKMSMCEA
jgi:hypothetical protein